MKEIKKLFVVAMLCFMTLIGQTMNVAQATDEEVTKNLVLEDEMQSYSVDLSSLNLQNLPFPITLRDFKADNVIFQPGVDGLAVEDMVTLDSQTKKPVFTDDGIKHIAKMSRNKQLKAEDSDADRALEIAKKWYNSLPENITYKKVYEQCKDSLYKYLIYHLNHLFVDVEGLNLQKLDQLLLTKNNKGVYEYKNGEYFPLDGQLFGDTYSDYYKKSHNYHFTLESHTQFYFSGEPLEFTFRGDDDVWVFINNTQVIDLGGVHGAIKQTMKINEKGEVFISRPGSDKVDIPLDLTIKPGWHDFDFFFMERRLDASNLNITTNMEFNPGIDLKKIPYLIENGQKVELDSESVVYPGQTIYYKFQIENSGNVDLTNVILKDPKLGLVVNSYGVYINNERIESEDAYQIKIGDSEGDLTTFEKLLSKDSHPFNIIEISSESFNYVVTNDDAVIGEVINQASVTGMYGSNTKFTETEASVDVVPLPSLSLEKIVIGSENEDDLFTIQVQGSDRTAFNVRLEAGETVTLEPMKYGVTYTIKEIVPMNYTLKDISGDINEQYEVSVTTDQQDYKVVITNEVTNTKWFQFKTRVENFVAQVKDKFHGEEGSK